MKKRIYFLAVAGMVLLSACKSTDSITPTMAPRETQTIHETYHEPPNGAIELSTSMDWEQVIEGTEEILNSNDYPLGVYLDYAVDEDNKSIILVWPLTQEATIEDAILYGQAYIKAFNDSAQMQNFEIALSDENNYGGLWNLYNLKLQVYREVDIVHEMDYYINQEIPAGTTIQLVSSTPDSSIPQNESEAMIESTVESNTQE